ncbi:uncharacterized protein ATNIH1004_004820 [Aspergillus tanneri]|uniref:Uncharacterized protein n=1 Tax=Aspergillus tanneri TaxID=1220188 RepID=A0A5M9MPD2_9EURO|nr:uncharacterized protein ATNIH1004_004820 [Aspergillus tanneri]KAA8648931.1 hypothetical protein ATNIH1004_004820 [Aspergillus tanneri]
MEMAWKWGLRAANVPTRAHAPHTTCTILGSPSEVVGWGVCVRWSMDPVAVVAAAAADVDDEESHRLSTLVPASKLST